MPRGPKQGGLDTSSIVFSQPPDGDMTSSRTQREIPIEDQTTLLQELRTPGTSRRLRGRRLRMRARWTARQVGEATGRVDRLHRVLREEPVDAGRRSESQGARYRRRDDEGGSPGQARAQIEEARTADAHRRRAGAEGMIHSS